MKKFILAALATTGATMLLVIAIAAVHAMTGWPSEFSAGYYIGVFAAGFGMWAMQQCS